MAISVVLRALFSLYLFFLLKVPTSEVEFLLKDYSRIPADQLWLPDIQIFNAIGKVEYIGYGFKGLCPIK